MYILGSHVHELVNMSGKQIKEKMANNLKVNREMNEKILWGEKEINDKELESWCNSIPRLINVIKNAGLENLYLILEYVVPIGDFRIDAVLIGYDHSNKLTGLIIELKQWAKIDETFTSDRYYVRLSASNEEDIRRHPIAQVEEYKSILNRNHSNIENAELKVMSCCYLHNFFSKETLFKNNYDIFRRFEDSIFCRNEEELFVTYLNSIFGKKTITDEYKVLTEGEYVFGKAGYEALEKILNGDKAVTLLNEQSNIFTEISTVLKHIKERKQVVVISGDVGTGKSIIGFEILRNFIATRDKWKCYFTVTSKTLKEIMNGFLNELDTADSEINKRICTGTYGVIGRNKGDLIIIDEAHRLSDIQENLKKAIEKFDVIVLLQDDLQRINLNEKGTKENIDNIVRNLESDYPLDFNSFNLKTQQRSGNGSNYVKMINKFLSDDFVETEELNESFQVHIYEKLKNMDEYIRDNAAKRSTMWIAPFCWIWSRDTSKNDIFIKDKEYIFEKPWNPLNNQFEWYSKRSNNYLNQVGCVYTTQGLEFQQTAVIFGDDLIWRNGKWQMNLNALKDGMFVEAIVEANGGKLIKKYLKENSEEWEVKYKGNKYNIDDFLEESKANKVEILQLVKNIYRILLTRATEEIHIWFKDEQTRTYFKRHFMLKEEK